MTLGREDAKDTLEVVGVAAVASAVDSVELAAWVIMFEGSQSVEDCAVVGVGVGTLVSVASDEADEDGIVKNELGVDPVEVSVGEVEENESDRVLVAEDETVSEVDEADGSIEEGAVELVGEAEASVEVSLEVTDEGLAVFEISEDVGVEAVVLVGSVVGSAETSDVVLEIDVAVEIVEESVALVEETSIRVEVGVDETSVRVELGAEDTSVRVEVGVDETSVAVELGVEETSVGTGDTADGAVEGTDAVAESVEEALEGTGEDAEGTDVGTEVGADEGVGEVAEGADEGTDAEVGADTEVGTDEGAEEGADGTDEGTEELGRAEVTEEDGSTDTELAVEVGALDAGGIVAESLGTTFEGLASELVGDAEDVGSLKTPVSEAGSAELDVGSEENGLVDEKVGESVSDEPAADGSVTKGVGVGVIELKTPGNTELISDSRSEVKSVDLDANCEFFEGVEGVGVSDRDGENSEVGATSLVGSTGVEAGVPEAVMLTFTI